MLSLGVLPADMLSAPRLAALSLLDSLAPAQAVIDPAVTMAAESTPAPSTEPEVAVLSHDNVDIGI